MTPPTCTPTNPNARILADLDTRSEWTVDKKTTVFDATKKMVDAQTGSLCVTSNGNIIGIITERDYLCKIVHEGRTSHNTLVDDICMHDDELLVACTSDLVEVRACLDHLQL
jgi:signal-transduction protein with cAMP-binding, CBS, and nucleotidyltransferase domain